MKYYTDGKMFYKLSKKNGWYNISVCDPEKDSSFEFYSYPNTDDYDLMQDKDFAQKDFMEFVAKNKLYLSEMPKLKVAVKPKTEVKRHRDGKLMISSSSIDGLMNSIYSNLGWSKKWKLNPNTMLFENDSEPISKVEDTNNVFFVTFNKQSMRYQLRLDVNGNEKLKGTKTAVWGKKSHRNDVVKYLENSVRRMF